MKPPKKLERPVLADGELTGHAHMLDSETDVFEHEDGVREFMVELPTTVRHEEHKPITLSPDKYLSDRVVETDPFEGKRRVLD